MLTFLINGDDGYQMFDVDGNVVEATFKPIVELTDQQVGVYERVELSEVTGSYAYIFKSRVMIDEPFNEGDYVSLFDYLEDFIIEQELDDEEDN